MIVAPNLCYLEKVNCQAPFEINDGRLCKDML